MDELAAVRREGKNRPNVLLVLDSMTGQEAGCRGAGISGTGRFSTGVVLTKLDGDARVAAPPCP